MLLRMLFFTVCLGLLPQAAWAWENDGVPQEGDPHYDIELLYAAEKYDEGLAKTNQKLAATPNDASLYWHKARFMFEVAEVYEKGQAPIDKLAHYEEMIAVCDKGLALDPGNPHILFARGIARGRLGTTRGILSSLFMAKDVESDWQKTLASGYEYRALNDHEVLPCDAHLTLGMYYRMVPDWWVIKMIAGTRGDLDRSLKHLLAAEACLPGRAQTIKELGVAQICKGQKDKDEALVSAGMANLQRAANAPVLVRTDEIDLRHSKMLISNPNMACEYSRDGQADLDKGKLEAPGATGD